MPINNKFDLTKAITFLLIFTLIAVLSLTILLVPAIREYKKQNGVYKIEYSLYLKAKERYDEENGKLKVLKNSNAKIIASLDKKIDESSLFELSKKYFLKTDIKKIGEEGEERGFLYSDFNITTSFKSPKELFGFLKALSDENAVAKVKTPLIMAGGNNGLISNFIIRVYHTNPNPKPKEKKTEPLQEPAAEHPHH